MTKHDWLSERIVFGGLIIFGFFSLGLIATVAPLTIEARQTAKDVLLVVGPLLGVIVNAIWKSDRTEKATAEAVATLAAKAPDQSGGPVTATTEKP